MPNMDRGLKLGLTKDVDFGVHGRLHAVSGKDKVKQIIFKALLTRLGSNTLIPGYGSTLSAVIGQKFDALAEFTLFGAVQSSVQFLIREQQGTPGLPLNETITTVSRVAVARDVNDPRIIRVTLEVRTASFDTVPILFQIVSA